MLADIGTLPPIATAETLTARPGLVDLWYFFYEPETDPQLLADYAALMTDAERARHARFYFERDRWLFLATRALVRAVLSRYAAVAPADWRFAEGSHGKPYIAGPEDAPRLSFNLSNTPGLVVCAVSAAHDQLGVDVERTTRSSDTVSIADRYFAPPELRALRALPAPAQPERFFAYWTLKESYIKARGLGLSLPLEQFWFLLDGRADIGIGFDPRLADDPARWRFALLRAAGYFVAVGADTGGAPLSLRGARLVPLRSVEPRPAW